MAAIDEVIVKVTSEEEIVASPAPTVAEKAKKVVAKKPRAPPAHPPYFEMISEALTTLKEKNGSSQYAIQKFIEENHKKLPSNFRKLLLVSLRKFVASGRLVKVKASFKLPTKATASTPKAKPSTTAAKPKKKVVAAPKKKTVSAAAKPKAKAKAKAVKAKPAVAAAAKPKAKAKTVAAPAKVAGTKRKAVAAAAKPKAAKVAKTAAKSTPSKKAAPAAKKAAPAAKKAAVKAVKTKSVKTAPKRALSTRGKK